MLIRIIMTVSILFSCSSMIYAETHDDLIIKNKYVRVRNAEGYELRFNKKGENYFGNPPVVWTPTIKNVYVLEKGTYVKLIGKNIVKDKYIEIGLTKETDISILKNSNSYLKESEINNLPSPLYINMHDAFVIIFRNKAYSPRELKNILETDLDKAIKSNEIDDLKSFVANYNNHEFTKKYIDEANSHILRINSKTNKDRINSEYNTAKATDTYEAYLEFNKKNPGSIQNKYVIENVYKLVLKNNSLSLYASFIKDFTPIKEYELKAIERIYELIAEQNVISGYEWFVEKFPEASSAEEAVQSIYKLVAKESNIAGYAWFIGKYSDYSIGKTALQNMYELAYNITQKENSLEAYNDFIIAYPYSKQIKQASDTAYELELDKYSSWSFGCSRSGERNSRALLVKSKQMERAMNSSSSDVKDGYRLVIDRMNKLLQDKFPSEEATLRYLESEEFKAFYEELNSSLRRINQVLGRIEDNTSNLSSILKEQSNMMDGHFRKAAQSKEMSEKYTKEYRNWDMFLRKEQGR